MPLWNLIFDEDAPSAFACIWFQEAGSNGHFADLSLTADNEKELWFQDLHALIIVFSASCSGRLNYDHKDRASFRCACSL